MSNCDASTSSLFSKFLPNYELMKQFTHHNSNLVHYSVENTLNEASSIKIFEFEESKQTKLKKKNDQAKIDQKIQADAAKKKEESHAKPVVIKKKQTIELGQNHILVAEFNKQNLDKFKIDEEAKIGMFDYFGSLHTVSPDFGRDKVTPLNPLLLNKDINVRFYTNVTTSQDYNITSVEGSTIYCTDKILSVLMTMNINSRPWHLLIKKQGSKFFIDSDENSGISLGVNEMDFTPDEEPEESVNCYTKLCEEATYLNEYIKEIVLGPKIEGEQVSKFQQHPFASSNPEENANLERSLYCYREWVIDGDIRVMVRCNIHAGELYYDDDGEEVLSKYNIYALNEYNVWF